MHEVNVFLFSLVIITVTFFAANSTNTWDIRFTFLGFRIHYTPGEGRRNRFSRKMLPNALFGEFILSKH